MSGDINTKPTILIVDDLEANLMLLKHLLDDFEIDLVSAQNGKDALDRAFASEHLAMVILDVNLPDISGFEVANALRAANTTSHVPIIFVSGVHHEQAHILEGYKAGAIDYIAKPIIPYILVSKVKIFLEHWQMRFDLENARKTAQTALETKDRFLSTMSHEIRTPLNGVLGVAQLLNQTQLDSTQSRYVDTIVKSGDLLMTLVNDLLDIAKLEAGQVMLEHITFDLRRLCEEVIELLAPNKNWQNIEVTLCYDETMPENFYGDPARIRQILFNLVGNALKFTKQGFVKLSVELAKSQSELCEVRLNIEDSGIGISAEQLEGLFTPFSQAEASTARKYGGTGLGLAICQNLSHLMGGELNVKSELNVGSTFSVTLPLLIANQRLKGNDGNVRAETFLLHGHILVAEDAEINQLVATSMLEKMGFKVSIAVDGQQAVEMWQRLNPDLILMDCGLPKLNGIDACKTIRTQEHETRIPIIALTADATQDNLVRCLESGMDAVITKPFDLETLGKHISPYLRADRLEKQASHA